MRESPDLLREQTPPVTGASRMTALFFTLVGPHWLRTYGIAFGMALLLTFTAANGTQDVPLFIRFPYWLILMVGGTLIAQITGRALDRFASLSLWQTVTAMIAITTPLICVMVWLVTAGFNSDHSLNPARLVHLVGPVLVITLAMAVLHVLINGTPAQSHAFAPENRTEPGAAFRERLPFKYRHAEIHALEAEDHYLRVHTTAGDTLILMRLYDAIRELDGIEGSQTHRSWWVARASVTDTVRSNGRVSFTLKDGLSAPVSRGFAKALKTDGWL